MGRRCESAEIHTCLCSQYGDSALSQRSVCERIEIFSKGWTFATDAEHLGCSSTSTRHKLEEA
jgi:hypothetical protein